MNLRFGRNVTKIAEGQGERERNDIGGKKFQKETKSRKSVEQAGAMHVCIATLSDR